MPTTTATVLPAKEIERTYLVELIPITGPTDGGPYEPRRVRLRYSQEQARDLDSRSERALQEAIDRAERLERREFITPADSVFEGRARLVKESLVDYLPRNKPRRS